MTNGIMS
jgi:hypothetical protein